jgi:hypothetical protein
MDAGGQAMEVHMRRYARSAAMMTVKIIESLDHPEISSDRFLIEG